MAPDAAFSAALSQLAVSGYPVTWQLRPTSARFDFEYQNIWHTAGMKARYEGSVTVSPVGPGQSQIQVDLTPVSSSLTSIYVAFAVGFAVVGFISAFSTGWLGIGLTLCFAAAGVYFAHVRFTDKTPTEEAKKLVARISLGSAGPQPAVAAQTFQTPHPQPPQAPFQPVPPAGGYSQPPEPPPVPQPPPSGGSSSSDVLMEQLKKLAQLKDAGLLDQSEFDAKKAELINRMLGS